MALDMEAKMIVCFTSSGRAARLLSKYKPPMPVLVVSTEGCVVVGCRAHFGLHGVPMSFDSSKVRFASTEANYAILEAPGCLSYVVEHVPGVHR